MFRFLLVACVALILAAPAVQAGQTKIKDYETARDKYFYKKLYPRGGWTLYCGAKFKGRKGLNVEHVLPASWMKKAANCEGYSRPECRQVSEAFNLMEADLHNLYPAIAKVNKTRWNYPFAIISGEARYFKDSDQAVLRKCDFELKNKRVEPRRISRGNIARAMFYMMRTYGIEIPKSQVKLLKRWNLMDPPSQHERRRNDKIEQIQGTRNQYIDRFKDVNRHF